MSDGLDFECVVVGGGAAGLSAALVLGRARRRVLLIDAGEQSNRVAPRVGGLFGHDGISPDALYRLGHEQLAPYTTIEQRNDRVTGAASTEMHFTVELEDGETVTAQRLLLATGMRYMIPELPGVAKLWGDTVFHCPFCHGWELRDRPLAVLGNGTEGAFRALLLRAWSRDVVLLTDGPADLGDQSTTALAEARVPIVERPVAGLVDCSRHGACGQHLESIIFADGGELPRDGLLVAAPLVQRDDLASQLGITLTDQGTVQVDSRGRTSVPGVYAAGDVTSEIQQVAGAAGAGAAAGTFVVLDLLATRYGIAAPESSAGLR